MKIIFLFFALSLSLSLFACGIPVISPQQQNCANMNIFSNPIDATFDRNELCGNSSTGLMNGENSGFLGL